jgi:hypothetical protein
VYAFFVPLWLGTCEGVHPLFRQDHVQDSGLHLYPYLVRHTWRSAPSFSPRPRARFWFTPLSLSRPAHIKECTLFFTKHAVAQDACVCPLREWKCAYLEASTVLITYNKLSLYLRVYSLVFSSLGWTST